MTKKKRRKVKLKYPFKYFLILSIVVIFYLAFFHKNVIKKIGLSNIKLLNPYSTINEEKERYDECKSKGLTEENFDDNTLNKKNELLEYAKNNDLRYTYEDLNYGYMINYRENEPLYGASLIKLVVAIYLLDNDIDLNQTIKYTSNFVAEYSTGMQNHKIGENVPILTLMKYSIVYSDNSAHHMLMSYIGKDKIREYAHGLGATAIFTGQKDNYGNQTTHDMAIYLKRAYQLIDEKENGHYLKEFMLNTKRNHINLGTDFVYAHKYGNFNQYYHDTGISYNANPFTIAIMTTKSEFPAVKYVNKMSSLSKEFNESYYANLETYCQNYSKQKD